MGSLCSKFVALSMPSVQETTLSSVGGGAAGGSRNQIAKTMRFRDKQFAFNFDCEARLFVFEFGPAWLAVLTSFEEIVEDDSKKVIPASVI